MLCDETKELLSRSLDNALPPEESVRLEAHLRDCASCRKERDGLALVGRLLRETPVAALPEDLWNKIEVRLESAKVLRKPWSPLAKLSAVAALLFLTGLTGWLAHFGSSFPWTSSATVVNLGACLDEMERSGSGGPHYFISQWHGEAVNTNEAARQVTFKLLTPGEPPAGFSLEKTYLLKMQCCTGVQTVYVRKGSEVLALFQHRSGPKVSYGDRPVIETRINGKVREITSYGDRLAASWQTNGTSVALMGAADMEELVSLVAFFDGKYVERKKQ